MGARIDLIALGRANFGLAPMRVLSQYTNGAIMLYADPQAATLPQDLYVLLASGERVCRCLSLSYRQLSGHQGMGGILRLRTTTEIDQDGYGATESRTASPSLRHLGNVYASPSATHLYHVGGTVHCCHTHTHTHLACAQAAISSRRCSLRCVCGSNSRRVTPTRSSSPSPSSTCRPPAPRAVCCACTPCSYRR